ncbi:MAG: hypothetical protein ACRD1B_02005 [Thermoanaerobaculia bacterium]
MKTQAEFEREWFRQWSNAARELAEQRRLDLARLTDDEARAATEALFALVTAGDPSAARWSTSGLVEQQAAFHRRKPA